MNRLVDASYVAVSILQKKQVYYRRNDIYLRDEHIFDHFHASVRAHWSWQEVDLPSLFAIFVPLLLLRPHGKSK